MSLRIDSISIRLALMSASFWLMVDVLPVHALSVVQAHIKQVVLFPELVELHLSVLKLLAQTNRLLSQPASRGMGTFKLVVEIRSIMCRQRRWLSSSRVRGPCPDDDVCDA